MEIGVAILYVVLGTILGAVGQGARAIIGVKKAADEAAVNICSGKFPCLVCRVSSTGPAEHDTATYEPVPHISIYSR